MLWPFIAAPWLALIPAAAFAGLAIVRRGVLSLTAALAWALYTAYEWAMHARILCTGECNIRVDLLLMAPVLLVLTAAAAIAAARGGRKRD
ncbi:MAG: hypothetical protein ABI886_02860 [Betaproteobacteria bacterium]